MPRTTRANVGGAGTERRDLRKPGRSTASIYQGGVAVRLGGRSRDLLTALVERPGEVLSKTDLIASAWPTTTVDESNLKVNIASLRRVLDDDFGAAHASQR
jgi:DNA-binding winged helix-turn-helix (wHTH) protein